MFGIPMAEAANLPGLADYLQMIFVINLVLLIFNMLPIYPLDGGQTLHALLWFVLGRAKSLRVAAVIGLIAAVLGGLLALVSGRLWTVLIAVFVGMQAMQGLRVARALAQLEEAGIPAPDADGPNPWQQR